jgi:hypothetical protein
MAFNLEIKGPTVIVTPGKFFAKELSFVKQNHGSHKFQ